MSTAAYDSLFNQVQGIGLFETSSTVRKDVAKAYTSGCITKDEYVSLLRQIEEVPA